MGKRFLKGVALGGLLAGLGVWMNTTPKGREKRAMLEDKLKKALKTLGKKLK